MKKFAYHKKKISLITRLIKIILRMYKKNSTLKNAMYLDPYTQFKNEGNLKNIHLKYPKLLYIKKLLTKEYLKNKNDKELMEFKNDIELLKFLAEHNKSVILSNSNLLKKCVLTKLGFNTPSPKKIKITPLVGTDFQHKSSNDIFNFCTDWLVSSFYLGLEANILIGAFYCMDNINKGRFFKLESDKYTIWLLRQIGMDYSRTLYIHYGWKSEEIDPEDYYFADFTKEDIMSREIFEDILYVLLNLILANSIIKYVKKTNLEDISSKDFFDKISLLMDKHYLKYKDEYKYLIKLRKFAISNYMSYDLVKKMSFSDLNKFEKEKLDKKYFAELKKLNPELHKKLEEYEKGKKG